jgi:Putative zinc-finger
MDMTTWHTSETALRAWVDGTCGPALGASVEQHVLRCAECRAQVADLVPAAPLAAGWEAVVAAVEVPRPSILERWLRRAGMSPADTVIMATAPRVLVAWFACLLGLLGFTFVARDVGGQDGGLVAFLLVAPLLPVAGVALAYGPGADPSYEVVLASPYRMFRLVLLRSAAVLATALPIIAGVGLLLPIATSTAVAWLLPALGFTVVVLAVGTWVKAEYAAGAIAVAWAGAVLWSVRAEDPLALLAPLTLLGYAIVLAGAAAVLASRLVAATSPRRLL